MWNCGWKYSFQAWSLFPVKSAGNTLCKLALVLQRIIVSCKIHRNHAVQSGAGIAWRHSPSAAQLHAETRTAASPDRMSESTVSPLRRSSSHRQGGASSSSYSSSLWSFSSPRHRTSLTQEYDSIKIKFKYDRYIRLSISHSRSLLYGNVEW